jgi:4'-phosphopantetheinyl transferase
VRQAPAEQYETVITAIWSAKEAALKALRLGLIVDTRSVLCSIGWPDRSDGWANVAFTFDDHLLGLDAVPALIGWWRRMGDFVLTVAATWSGRHGCDEIISTNHMVGLGGVGGAWGGQFSPKPRPFTQKPA